jgi:starch phosphorylase
MANRLATTGYRPREVYERNAYLREVSDGLLDGPFSKGDRELFKPLIEQLLTRDRHFLLSDFDSYATTQEACAHAHLDELRWGRMSIMNRACSGKFYSDRTIQEYCRDICDVPIGALSETPNLKHSTIQTGRRTDEAQT